MSSISDFFAVDNRGEGGLVSNETKIEITPNTATVIIGLGGTGVDALLRIKGELYRRFKLADRSDLPPMYLCLLLIRTKTVAWA